MTSASLCKAVRVCVSEFAFASVLLALVACEPTSHEVPTAAPAASLAPPADQGLELAVLESLPQFADTSPRRHVAAHGALPTRPDGPTAPGLNYLSFADLAAPNYEAPGVASGAEPADLATVLAPAVLSARGGLAVIDGFATVEQAEGGFATVLLLTPLPPTCCLGRVPHADERVQVALPATLNLVVDPWRPVRVVGRFAAEERRDVLGLFEGLYFLDAESARSL